MRLSLMGILPTRTRRALAEEGRALKVRIEALGTPRMWGLIPPEILQDVTTWQQKCAAAGLSQAAVYHSFDDLEHTSGGDVLLVVDEILTALDPPGSMGG